jgi:hypothetical protein
MNRARVFFFALQAATVASITVGVACGSRTGLLVPVPPPDASEDAGVDAPPDVAHDAHHRDAHDAPVDSPPDTFVQFDAPDLCPDAGATLIYVITSQNVLMSFYPPTASFTTIGTIACPDPTGSTPFSMAVSRSGIAYVVFNPSGNLFKVSTRTAACIGTSFAPGNDGFPLLFGMGYSADVNDAGPTDDGGADGGAGETLYVAGDPGAMIGTLPVVLGTIDTTTFQTRTIGTVAPPIYASELTGTGSGQLFGFFLSTPTVGGAGTIGQLDKTTAQLVSSTPLPGVNVQGGWAFAFWGGDFYTFTAPDGTDTIVQRYRPSDGSIVQVAMTSGLTVVGAGVSTCAPQ